MSSIDSGVFPCCSFPGRKVAFTSGHVIAIDHPVGHCAAGATTKTGGRRNRAQCAIESSAASFGLRPWKRRQMGLIRWEGRACRDRQKRTRQACPSRLQSNPFIAEAMTSRREASSDSPCRAQAAPPDTKRLRHHEISNTSFI